MKKILFFAAAALSLAACSNEGVITGGPDIPQPSEGTNLSFNLSLPGGEPITYAGKTHTNSERQIHQLAVYQFAGEGDDARLEEIYGNVVVSPKSGVAEDLYTAFVNVKSLGKKQFVLVANNKTNTDPGYFSNLENPTKGESTGVTLSTFKQYLSKKLVQHLNGTPLVMTSVANKAVSGGTTTVVDIQKGVPTEALSAKLERVMARLDIVNKEPLLKLDRVRLINTKNQAYLFPKDSPSTEGEEGTTAAPNEDVNTLPWITLPEAAPGNDKVGYDNTTVANEVHYKHVFYPYPSNIVKEKNDAPTVLIEGTLYPNTDNPQKVFYRKELKKDGVDEYLGFKRNHIYKLVINKATKDAVDITLRVDEWNVAEDILYPKVEVVAPKLAGTITTNTIKFSSTDLTLTFAKPAATAEINVIAQSDWEALIDPSTPADWVEQVSVQNRNATITNIPNKLVIKVKANDSNADRPADPSAPIKIILRSKADPTKSTVLTLTQKNTDTI